MPARSQTEGRCLVRRNLKHYNLDAIISVGYRVNSKRGVRLRQWATRTLREHLVRGHTLNEQRLAERDIQKAQQTIDLLARTLNNHALVDEEDQRILTLITDYADTWRLLLEYDEDRLKIPTSTQPVTSALNHEKVVIAINVLRHDLIAKHRRYSAASETML